MVSELTGCSDRQIDRIINKIRSYAGGQKFCVSLIDTDVLDRRNSEIKAKHKYKTKKQLSVEYSLSYRQISRIISGH